MVGVTEDNLANDPAGEVTDQNHAGGAAFVRALADAAGVASHDHVLDLCSGLGGPARLLASSIGCRVTGIEISPERWAASRFLTNMVGLDHLVDFACGDVMTVDVREASHDVLWGQSAWIHLFDKAAFVRRWTPSLRDGGRLAFEDACITTRPRRRERGALEELQAIWRSTLVTCDEWASLFSSAGLQPTRVEDVSHEAETHFASLLQAPWTDAEPHIEIEKRGWALARSLLADGSISYVRIVATSG
jgi:cyclopropane fatty-acyl-phospholipid synthase-like methyltransferase